MADQAALAKTSVQADLGKLGALAGTGLASDDHDLVVADGLEQLLAALGDRQLGWIRALRYRRQPARQALLGFGDLAIELPKHLFLAFCLLDLAGAFDPATQTLVVCTRHSIQALMQRPERVVGALFHRIRIRPTRGLALRDNGGDG